MLLPPASLPWASPSPASSSELSQEGWCTLSRKGGGGEGPRPSPLRPVACGPWGFPVFCPKEPTLLRCSGVGGGALEPQPPRWPAAAWETGQRGREVACPVGYGDGSVPLIGCFCLRVRLPWGVLRPPGVNTLSPPRCRPGWVSPAQLRAPVRGGTLDPVYLSLPLPPALPLSPGFQSNDGPPQDVSGIFKF